LRQELIGNEIANSLGIWTPAPGTVLISADTAVSFNDAMVTQGAAYGGPAVLREQSAVGTVLIYPPPVPLLPMQKLSDAQRQQALLIFTYDLLTLNGDRTVSNPNCGLLQGNIIACDFEHCFGFLHNPNYQPLGPGYYGAMGALAIRHMFYPYLRRRRLDLTFVESVLAELTDDRVIEVLEGLPGYCYGDGAMARVHLNHIRGDLRRFLLELPGILQCRA
jgi:hypothetical protein